MLRIAAVAMVLAACDVGSVLNREGADGNGGGDDGNGSGSGSGSNCEPLAGTIPTDHHNAGMGCMTAAGCHNAGLGLGANAPEYSYGGTVYRDAAGTQPYPGATILITQGGVTKKLIAGDTGNFQITPLLLATPTAGSTSTTKASSCPSTTAMSGTLIAGGGNCNGGGTCHGGTQGKIHLP